MADDDNIDYSEVADASADAASPDPVSQGFDPSELYSGVGGLTAAQQAAAGKEISTLRGEGEKEYQTALGQQQKVASAARAALRSARDRLASEKPDNGPMWLAVAEAMGAPHIGGGGFGAEVLQGMGAASRFKDRDRTERLNRLANIDDLNVQLAGYGDEKDAYSPDIMQTRLAQARLKQMGANTLEATLLRRAGPSAAGQTELQKYMQLRDTLPPGSPDRKMVEDKIRLLTTRAPGQQPFSAPMEDLMSAIADVGAPTPVGMRSVQAQRSLFAGMLRNHPDMTPREIAIGLRNGSITYKGEQAAARAAGTVAGNVAVAENEIKNFAPMVRQASAAVPRDHWLPVQKLMQLRDEQLQDPKLRALKASIAIMLNAVDQLAARGGTDVGKRDTFRKLIMSADSPQVIEQALQYFEKEAAGAHKAAHTAIVTGGGSYEAPPDELPQDGPDLTPTVPSTKQVGNETWTLHHDAKGRWAYVSPDGKKFQKVQQ